jgi:hypothetical protein
MADENTWYPGVGADAAIAALERAVGKFTGYWAQVEDGLFELFVVALVGTHLTQGLQIYRGIFFTFSSFESKMRLLNNAMRSRFGGNKSIST